MESFFHSLKAELVHGARFETETALRQAIAGYVRYYNHRRIHSALAYRSPVTTSRVQRKTSVSTKPREDPDAPAGRATLQPATP